MRMNSPQTTTKYVSPSNLRAKTPAVKYDQRKDRLMFEYNVVPGPNFYVKQQQSRDIQSPQLNQSDRKSTFLNSMSQIPYLQELEPMNSFKFVSSYKRIPIMIPNAQVTNTSASYIKSDKNVNLSPFSYSPQAVQRKQFGKINSSDRFKKEKISIYDSDRGPVGYKYYQKLE